MSDTTKVTVQFTGTITYDAARLNCEGHPHPLNGQTHEQAMADEIRDSLNDKLMYGEGDLEPTDYVQAIHGLTVKGVTPAEIKRAADLETVTTRARELLDGFADAVAPLLNDNGDPRDGCEGQYDSVMGDYEGDAWSLVQLLATYAKASE